MTVASTVRSSFAPTRNEVQNRKTDVLVIGGGPAGCWAALTALEAGASVMLIEKGYVGTSGATAAGNTTMIYSARGTAERGMSVDQRVRLGAGLADGGFVERVLDEARFNLDRLADWGYDFPSFEDGRPYRGMLRGADYLRFMRQRLIKGGAVVCDHMPADHLLVADGVVSGAAGYERRGGARWQVVAGATIIATGGCAYMSGALGTNNLTGDGYLLGAEAGAVLSGMEFSAQYGIAPAFSSVTKGIIYFWATFSDSDGAVIDTSGDRHAVAKYLLRGPVYAVLDKVEPRLQEGFRRGQPNIFVPFDRMGIDPFTQRFPVTLRHEGTVRGTGGLLIDNQAATSVPGLFAAGDASSRELMSGAVSGGGGPNASYAIATGRWAGAAAVAFARRNGVPSRVRPAAEVADLTPAEHTIEELRPLINTVQDRMLPLDRGFFRDAQSLQESEAVLGQMWRETGWRKLGRMREVEAMLATARWATAGSLARKESRGVHRRTDFPLTDPLSARSLQIQGLDHIRVGGAEEPVERRLAG
ncbi:FAD-binding protein [Aureimonas fodinaquatilis]|uniref:FAD-binding protein n=1 Tax=Aureimonas fodinaquatilis TaxID=2565783 RepID=A0A5B0DVW3_9HYPH|nr:FAD-binding protein [Aureimonas fodinaquatilis]KAA0970894.1 FAD-binding protein [Aureimonas fodinaquatilis]